jgi:hypothetical protein
VSVPRAKATLVNPDGGVAVLGPTITAVIAPAIPKLSTAHVAMRFMSSSFRFAWSRCAESP